jgi:hypothetical protein
MDMEPELAREWIAAARSLQGTMESFQLREAMVNRPAGVAAQTGNISVNVEDPRTQRLVLLSVFSAVLCALLSIITLAGMIGGTILYLNMKDHLDAIYMMAPQLKPTGDKVP